MPTLNSSVTPGTRVRRYDTELERKEAIKIHKQRYYQKNKEKFAEANKKRRDATNGKKKKSSIKKKKSSIKKK